jgi:type I site-specific restriction endonuclease
MRCAGSPRRCRGGSGDGSRPGDLAVCLRDFRRTQLHRRFSRIPSVVAGVALGPARRPPGWLAERIDPGLQEKTIVFCVNDAHADMVVEVLKDLDGFSKFLRENMNRLPALNIVLQRPRDLTRAELKELRLALDEAGYSDAFLRTAWREKSNADIAASIIGFIRQAALGDPLVPYEERVDRAVKNVLASQRWTDPQRKWLERTLFPPFS